jgi:hypothetical protein
MRTLCRLLFALLLGVAVMGCGAGKPKLVTVTGKVLFKNEPVTGGSIWFVPEAANTYQGEKPSCLLQVDGSFNMRTYPYGNGVPPGPYKVMLHPEVAGRLKRPDYGDAAKTPLSVTIPDSGLKDHMFEVK